VLPPLSKELRDAGAVRATTRVPDPITLEWLQGQVATLEHVLRMQFEGDRLPGDHEAELKAIGPPDDMGRALRRWVHLKHVHRLWWDGKDVSGTEGVDTGVHDGLRAMDELLRREPIVLQLRGRRVEVTGRSYSAMYEMAAHGMAADRALQEADRIRELYERARKGLGGGIRRRLHVLRRLRRLERLHRIAYTEAELHRQAFYAHALTPDGAPADDPANAPRWWRGLGPIEHAALMAAFQRAGPVRGSRLPPPKKTEGDKGAGDSFGGLALLVAWGVQTGVGPASTLHRDYGQVVAEIRANAETHASSARDEMEYL